MKKAFTMVELIFVIVILGVLAAVAVPKLNATKDDAKIAKIASDIKRLVSDIDIYFAKNGEIEQFLDFRKVTNVALKCHDKTCEYHVDDSHCIKIVADHADYVVLYYYEPEVSKNCKNVLNKEGFLVGYDRGRNYNNRPENIQNLNIVSFKNASYFAGGGYKGIIKYYE